MKSIQSASLRNISRLRNILILLIAGILVFIPALNALMFHSLQLTLQIKMDGQFIPSLTRPSFDVIEAKFSLPGKVRVLGGDLNVSYDLVSLFLWHPRIKLQSKKVKIELLGEWSKAGSGQPVELERFFSDLEIGPRGIKEIHAVEAWSPSFQFQLRHSDKEKKS